MANGDPVRSVGAALLRRHDLLRVDPSAWNAMLSRQPALADIPLVAGWTGRGYPVIVRRRLCGDDADAVPAGLPLPPSHGKRRIAIALPPGAVAVLPPLLLRDAARAAPRAWQGAVAALLELGQAVETTPRVFGALLWEQATGLPYLTAGSDLDLIWPVPDRRFLDRVVGGLLRLDADGPVRLDGEILLPDGRAVQWREIAEARGPSADVLVKSVDGVAMCPVASLFPRAASAA